LKLNVIDPERGISAPGSGSLSSKAGGSGSAVGVAVGGTAVGGISVGSGDVTVAVSAGSSREQAEVKARRITRTRIARRFRNDREIIYCLLRTGDARRDMQ
jgi:hypothetical protein